MMAWLVILLFAVALLFALAVVFTVMWLRLGAGRGAAVVIPLAVIALALTAWGARAAHRRLAFILSGGTELLYRLDMDRVPAGQRAEALPWTISVLEKRLSDRISQLSFCGEMRVERCGSDRILIQLAGLGGAELANIRRVIETAGRLEFRLVNDDSDDKSAAKEGRRIAGCTPFVKRHPTGAEGEGTEGWYEPVTYAALKDESDRLLERDWLLVNDRAEITGQSLGRAYASVDDRQLPAVGFEFDTEGKRQFGLVTERNIGKQLAIVLDSKIYSAPVIQSRVPGAGIIHGSFTQAQVNDLVAVLRSGVLPAPLILESERSFARGREGEPGAEKK